MKSVILDADDEIFDSRFTTALYNIPIVSQGRAYQSRLDRKMVRVVGFYGGTPQEIMLHSETQWRRLRDILSELLGETK